MNALSFFGLQPTGGSHRGFPVLDTVFRSRRVWTHRCSCQAGVDTFLRWRRFSAVLLTGLLVARKPTQQQLLAIGELAAGLAVCQPTQTNVGSTSATSILLDTSGSAEYFDHTSRRRGSTADSSADRGLMIMTSPHHPKTAILVPRPNSIRVSPYCHKRCDFEVLKISYCSSSSSSSFTSSAQASATGRSCTPITSRSDS